MSTNNTVQLASVRVITEDLPRLVRFYEVVTGATAHNLADDFAELATPSAAFALSHPSRFAFISGNPRAAANNSAVVESLVNDERPFSPGSRPSTARTQRSYRPRP